MKWFHHIESTNEIMNRINIIFYTLYSQFFPQITYVVMTDDVYLHSKKLSEHPRYLPNTI